MGVGEDCVMVREAEDKDAADDAAAADEDDADAITESAYVVWTAMNVFWAMALLSSVVPPRMATQKNG